MLRADLERETGNLFGKLWGRYDEPQFEGSVALFSRRLTIAGIDLDWFAGKHVLDAGCGGGRNSVAMARLGAAHVDAVDVATQGLDIARRRTAELPNVRIQQASILDLPYPDESFDLVWCAGVLMITDDEDRALDELVRVLKPGGKLYLLVYATGGIRWPLIQTLRPIAAEIGQAEIDRAIQASGMPANSRSMFLDDLFCPKLDFYDWSRLRRMLERRGLTAISRWGQDTRLDHEQDLAAYRRDLEILHRMWAAGAEPKNGSGRYDPLFSQGLALTEAAIDTIAEFERRVGARAISREHAEQIVIGQGHHRLFATKGGQ